MPVDIRDAVKARLNLPIIHDALASVAEGREAVVFVLLAITKDRIAAAASEASPALLTDQDAGKLASERHATPMTYAVLEELKR